MVVQVQSCFSPLFLISSPTVAKRSVQLHEQGAHGDGGERERLQRLLRWQVASNDDSGATTITLTTAGVHYFICNVRGHCGSGDIGMKFTVNATVAGGDVGSRRGSTIPADNAGALLVPATSTVAAACRGRGGSDETRAVLKKPVSSVSDQGRRSTIRAIVYIPLPFFAVRSYTCLCQL